MVRAPIHSEKHISQTSLSSIAQGAANGVELIKAVAVADKDLVKEVTEGSIIKAIFIEFWVKSLVDTGLGTVITICEKVENAAVAASFAQMVALNDYPNKKNILYTQQGLTPTETSSNPMSVVKGWIKIPKGKQRFGLGDSFHIRFASQAEGISFCGFALYKEYS